MPAPESMPVADFLPQSVPQFGWSRPVFPDADMANLEQLVERLKDDASETVPEVSVVMPCLNEADTLATCIRKARAAIASAGLAGEILVADNGSTDGSPEIAVREGARLVAIDARGYGHALMGGIRAARGKYIVMGDCDDSYDFGEIPRFVARLREGFDLVQGCRLPAGGGQVMPGAMPFLHRWIGNPALTALTRRMFKAPIHDIYCGLRGFTRDFYDRLNLACGGMEFAVEMITRATLHHARMCEIPITLHPDGRESHPPHLRTFRDGWRTLRLLLLCNPRWLFVYPGMVLVALGLLASGIAMPQLRLLGVTFDVHTLLVGCLAILLGAQAITLGCFGKLLAIREGLRPADAGFMKWCGRANLERGLLAGLALAVLGLGMIGYQANLWRLQGFGSLDYAHSMRLVIPGCAFTALGFQTALASFFLSVLGMSRR